MVKGIHEERYMVQKTKIRKKLEKRNLNYLVM